MKKEIRFFLGFCCPGLQPSFVCSVLEASAHVIEPLLDFLQFVSVALILREGAKTGHNTPDEDS